jgi:hypothetical protein
MSAFKNQGLAKVTIILGVGLCLSSTSLAAIPYLDNDDKHNHVHRRPFENDKIKTAKYLAGSQGQKWLKSLSYSEQKPTEKERARKFLEKHKDEREAKYLEVQESWERIKRGGSSAFDFELEKQNKKAKAERKKEAAKQVVCDKRADHLKVENQKNFE